MKNCDPEVETNTTWHDVSITAHTATSVSINASLCVDENNGFNVGGIRYLFRTTPCEYKKCPIYSVLNELPALPFVIIGNFD